MATIRFDQLNTQGNEVVTDQALKHIANKIGVSRHSINTATTNIATTDTGYLIPVAPNTAIIGFTCEIVTAEGATATADFGILGDDVTNDPNGLDDAVNLNAAAGTITGGIIGTDAGLWRSFGDGGGYITLNVDNDLDTAVFDITVLYAFLTQDQ